MKISSDGSSEPSYSYLIRMPIYNFSEEEINSLNNELNNIQNEYNVLDKKTFDDLWNEDLDKFVEEYKKVKTIIPKKIVLKKK